ncbi:uncharacterized protein LOC110601226 isoform X2 [Manihot esculenta]|uniref:Uncharacterized protein n=1 Tax=Manihot esculenta TaxID=3983 RepID=A0ACB7GEF5_MANES|nr:uncharacterized protein LOC110601226 isoform X2 [Manihot esculenta]KAG8637106.1 hypothetical protein MANES_15G083000v8 [Manihot esculenta]
MDMMLRFHQCSSQQLKALFTHSGEGSMSSDIDLKGPSSPKLPSSVSRSRGKHYASNKCGGNGRNLSLNKQHPVKVLNGNSSRVNSGSGKEIKPKISFINSKRISRSKRSFVLEKDLTQNVKENDLKGAANHGTSECSPNSVVDKAGESTSSTITSESGLKPQQRNLEVSSQAFGYSSGLLSAIRISLRKSCVTRQASRGDFNNNNGRQSRGHSTGSSSNPHFDFKSSTVALVQHREWTPDSRNAAGMTRATKNKDHNVSKDRINNVRREKSFSKIAHQEVEKSKVQNKSLGGKALQQRVNGQGSLAGAAKARQKVMVGRHDRLMGGGNENAIGRVPLSPKFSANGVIARGQKEAKQNVPLKTDRTRLVGPKEKNSSLNRGKHPTNATQSQRVYLR